MHVQACKKKTLWVPRIKGDCERLVDDEGENEKEGASAICRKLLKRSHSLRFGTPATRDPFGHERKNIYVVMEKSPIANGITYPRHQGKGFGLAMKNVSVLFARFEVIR